MHGPTTQNFNQSREAVKTILKTPQTGADLNIFRLFLQAKFKRDNS